MIKLAYWTKLSVEIPRLGQLLEAATKPLEHELAQVTERLKIDPGAAISDTEHAAALRDEERQAWLEHRLNL